MQSNRRKWAIFQEKLGKSRQTETRREIWKKDKLVERQETGITIRSVDTFICVLRKIGLLHEGVFYVVQKCAKECLAQSITPRQLLQKIKIL